MNSSCLKKRGTKNVKDTKGIFKLICHCKTSNISKRPTTVHKMKDRKLKTEENELK